MDNKSDDSEEPAVKRRRIATQLEEEQGLTDESSRGRAITDTALQSLTRDISPPPRFRPQNANQELNERPFHTSSKGKPYDRDHGVGGHNSRISDEPRNEIETDHHANYGERAEQVHEEIFTATLQGKIEPSSTTEMKESHVKAMISPFLLTHIRDLPDEDNVDSITIYDILNDPMIKECWQFNYLFDVRFIMEALDSDVASTVRVKIVHGFSNAEDGRRLRLEKQAQAYPNVELIAAHMPEPFGTHHSKMMILFRHDDAAQVIIHTANMIQQDWANLTQGVWRSSLLPLQNVVATVDSTSDGGTVSTERYSPIGSGTRFKTDLIRYLQAYERRTRKLVEDLDRYDFSSIRAAFISSVPARVPEAPTSNSYTEFGWPGLRQILSTIDAPTSANPNDQPGFVVAQVSSIATLSEAWLNTFLSVLRTTARPTDSSPRRAKPKAHIIFPSTPEIRASLDGYASGASIHAKLALPTPAHQKQLARLRPLLCRWSGSSSTTAAAAAADQANADGLRTRARRGRAAPHIKTYAAFADARGRRVAWAALSSANLSTQAWGSVGGGAGAPAAAVRIASYEVGVVVWPALFGGGGRAAMVPAFGSGAPAAVDVRRAAEDDCDVVVGLRLPYDLPLSPYGPYTLPWCGSASHSEPDWMGKTWRDVEPVVGGKRTPGARMMQSEGD